MAVDDEGLWKNPAFLGSGAPEVDVDPTAVSNYFAEVAGALFDTVTDGLGETPPGDGYLFRANDAPGAWFEYVDSGWVMHGVPRFADATGRDAVLTSPAARMRALLEDTDTVWRYKGSAWVLESGSMPYTPALTGITAAKGTLDSHYTRDGDLVTVEGSFAITDATAMTGSFKIAVPVPMAAKYGATPSKVLGEAIAHDVGTNEFPGFVTSDASTSVVALKVQNAAGTLAVTGVMSNVLIVWATGDGVSWRFTYLAA